MVTSHLTRAYSGGADVPLQGKKGCSSGNSLGDGNSQDGVIPTLFTKYFKNT